jgi:primosomal protein N' (replication factor Y)
VSQARVRPRTERTAVLARKPSEDERASLARSAKKLAALRALEASGGAAAVARLKAAEPTIATHLRALAKLGLVRFEDREAAPQVARAGGELDVHAPHSPPPLNERQRAALAAIRAGLRQGRFAAYLLYGITSSGKTEVYLNAIADVIAAGKTAVVLVPEISLTPQLAARFRARFGDRVAVLHSGLTSRERFDEWQRLQSGSARIALGARSAVFAPVANLGMIVVDEEHDSSFKQDEGVRYNGRDVALVRAQRAGAVCVLGSATPALESFHAARSGRYQLLRLPERATARPLPEVELVDLRVYQPEHEAMLTAPLADAIRDTLDRGEQVILFLNRRGFDTFVLCRACGQAFRCVHCSVSLTYHRSRDRLVCHYCGSARRVPDDCPSCAAKGAIMRKGLGTEKVADAVARRFAGARVARLDRDVATGARVGAILGQVASREVDILVGTQMVTKGHDFPGVTLVGVLWADAALSLPDFRASERTFQLLTQVAGRAGRGTSPGRVLIQSYRTDAVAIAAAANHDYEGFYCAEIAARRELGYPPFSHLAALRIDGRDARAVEAAARELARQAENMAIQLELDPAQAILGPSEAPLARIKGRTRWHIWLRAAERPALRRLVRAVARPDAGDPRGVRVTVDVDPISAL